MSQPVQPTSQRPDDGLAYVEEEVLTSFRFRDRPESLGLDVSDCLWITWPWTLWLLLAKRLSADPTYHVPPRFGMSAIIGITTLLALLFAMFRAVDAHPIFYFFCTILLLVVVVVQMRWGHVARPASIVAWAVWFPLFLLTLAGFVDEGRAFFGICCLVPFLIPLGGILGYLAGTCAGGFFLLMELFERWWDCRLGRDESVRRTPPTQLDDVSHPS